MLDRLTYVLRFHRPPYDPAPPADEPEPPTTASGLTVATRIDGGTFHSDLEALPGDEAVLQLQFATNRDSSLFFEWGSLTFGGAGAGSLTFSSLGVGTL